MATEAEVEAARRAFLETFCRLTVAHALDGLEAEAQAAIAAALAAAEQARAEQPVARHERFVVWTA